MLGRISGPHQNRFKLITHNKFQVTEVNEVRELIDRKMVVGIKTL